MRCCPTCMRPFPPKGPVRICFGCEQPIKRSHKWRINSVGRIEHLDCDNPEIGREKQKPKQWYDQLSLL